MAMLPFCGYNMADYWQHWVNICDKPNAELPGIYYVNWFLKDDSGKYLWPGFGENSRVLKWIFERCEGTAEAIETPIGNLPRIDGIDFSGLELMQEEIEQLLRVEINGWLAEIPLIEAYYESYGDRVPVELREELGNLKQRLEDAKKAAA
tara:strand:- start:56 stop:505 length:450 start_codon:yes stop_codon:yes gene_type:complete